MSRRVTLSISAISWILLVIFASRVYAQNDIVDQRRDPFLYQNKDDGNWFQTAKNAIQGPAGQIIVHFSKEAINRSAGNSQVGSIPSRASFVRSTPFLFQILSLNLSNLFVLLLLKALIFAAGLIGAGNWGHYARARALDCEYPSEFPFTFRITHPLPQRN